MGRPAGQDGQRRGRGGCPDPEQYAVLCWLCSIAICATTDLLPRSRKLTIHLSIFTQYFCN